MAVKHPCRICKKAVAKNHKAVHCDGCNQWIHIKCNYTSSQEYNKLINSTEAWLCKECIPYFFPFSSLTSEKLKLLHHGKNIELDNMHNESDNSDQNNFYKEKNGININIDDTILPPCDYVTPCEVNSTNLNQAKLTLEHLNISSLSFHLDELSTLLNHKIDIIGISESKIKSNCATLANITLDGYNIAQSPTESN